MATRTLLFVTAVAGTALSAACQTLSPMEGGSCNTHECHVKVIVTDCHITLKPDPISIFEKNVEIHWDIVGTGFTFATNGIVIKDDTQAEFGNCHLAEHDMKFMCHDKNTFHKTYKYVVNVKQGSAACPPLDPSIVNN